MPVTKINAKGKGKDKSGREVTFTFEKVIHPGMTKGTMTKGEDGKRTKNPSTYPSYAELAQLYMGRIEIKVDKNGQPETDDCLVLDAILGRNLRVRNAEFQKVIDTPDAAMASIEKEMAKQAKKFGLTVEEFAARLLKKTA